MRRMIVAAADNNIARGLINGLKKLEYRGRGPSATLAAVGYGSIERARSTCSVAEFEAATGFARRATDGVPSECNAHPRVSGNITLFDNDIIENYESLCSELTAKGYVLISGSDFAFGYKEKDYERFCMAKFDSGKRSISIEEKPLKPKSRYAVTGLHFCGNDVANIAKKVKHPARGELEIRSVNLAYLERGDLDVELVGSHFSWLDTGTGKSHLEAGYFVETIESRQGNKIECLEKIVSHNGWLYVDDLRWLGETLRKKQL